MNFTAFFIWQLLCNKKNYIPAYFKCEHNYLRAKYTFEIEGGQIFLKNLYYNLIKNDHSFMRLA